MPLHVRELAHNGHELTHAGVAAHRAVTNIINVQKAQSTLIIADPLMVALLTLSFLNGHQASKRVAEQVVGTCQGYLLASRSADNAMFSITRI